MKLFMVNPEWLNAPFEEKIIADEKATPEQRRWIEEMNLNPRCYAKIEDIPDNPIPQFIEK